MNLWNFPAVFLAGVVLSSASSTHAQHTVVYAYDAHGRLTNSGSDINTSTSYRYDRADNRVKKSCCLAIGSDIQADGFDPYYYVVAYHDVRLAGVSPYGHWLSSGYSEARNPNRFFDTAYYRATYGVPATVNALTDYHTTGWRLGRNPSREFSTNLYLAAHPDVAAANVNPLLHYLKYGYAEGRAHFPAP
ncbi:hypothetical protein [Brevundimonas diminuta]|uniref:hypothetical protein n=1 Tax=Brevundimonas diminuta TaxID=293 RepID=UPI0028AF5FE2|nr:hypothetical protein [Brevundimonas diminuta]